MKTLTRSVVGIALSFFVLFACLGYAELTDTLTIHGAANANPPPGLYITETVVDTAYYANRNDGEHIPYSTTVDSTVNLSSYGSSWNRRYGYVKYKITVWNNTSYQYAYSGLEYQKNLSGYNGNSYLGDNITITVTDANGGSFVGDVVNPNEHVTFYATYTINRNNLVNTDLRTLVNYKFGVNIDSVDSVALDAALVRFSEILNDTTAGGGYETLVDKINDKYDGVNDWKANYIGNVVDAHNADTETINSLFQGRLSLTIDGIVTNVTVLIKRENLDGNTQTGDDYVATYNGNSTAGYGCEMTLYMTTDELQSGSPVVYAAVFTCDRNEDGSYGNWYMIGDKYVGTASIVGYEGEYRTGSFDTGTWRSTGNTSYSVSADYVYSVSAGQTIGSLITVTDSRATSKMQTLLTQAYDVLNGKYGSYAGSAVINLQSAFDSMARYYTVNGDTVTLNSGLSRAEVIPQIKKLENVLKPFESIINQ